jgi:uncharacterized protein (TIGR03067 family)
VDVGRAVHRRAQIVSTERDLAALQGVWQQVGLEVDGVADPPDSYSAPGALTTFTGNQFAVRAVDGTLLLAGTFTLDATTTPRSVTWIDSMGPDTGKQLPSSYLLDGDHFVFIAGDEGAPRPTVFRTGPGQTMRTFARR